MNSMRLTESLTPKTPYFIELTPVAEDEIEVVIATFDFPSIFSLLTGLLSSLGFLIASGEIRTLKGTEAPSRRRERARSGPGVSATIIDRFTGTLPRGTSRSGFQRDVDGRLAELTRILLEAERTDPAIRARRRVNEWVADAVSRFGGSRGSVLLPVELDLDTECDEYAWVALTAQDTPFFLYSVATAITLQGYSIERVEIETRGGTIRDRLALLDGRGGKPASGKLLDRLRFSILFTKQFTFFLGEAPDPYAAIVRFENLLEELALSPDVERWKDLLENPDTLRELARLLGMSTFLWEEFIRLQYENILPLLGGDRSAGRSGIVPVSREDFEYRLQVALSRSDDYRERQEILNRFKDDEIYRLDLSQMLSGRGDFLQFSRDLTLLAEAVVATAFALAEEELTRRYGTPRTVAGLPALWTLLGLGKLGGQALGYASDIELLCVYSDNGATDGEKEIPNSEYFDRLVREATGMISAKQEGIFHIDLRLRPHGGAGPHATSLQRFASYYRDEAHSFERLALVRLRAFAGDADLGGRVELLRDEIVYAPASLDLEQLRSLRQRQLAEKSRGGSFNAKFSTGALVDLEYTVQILQVEHGQNYPPLRTPSIHTALEELTRRGVIRGDEAQEIVWAYRFLRRLINALRMLRGSAQDLYLPELDSDEYSHLARRMGYRGRAGLSPREQLHTEFEQRTARVRGFVEGYLGRDSLPSQGAGTIADLILYPEREENRRLEILARYGFKNPVRGLHNFDSLARLAPDRETFASVAILAVHELAGQSDPDMALNNWERFAGALGRDENSLQELLSQPTRITLLMQLFSGSQSLSDTLIGEPGLFREITDPASIHRVFGIDEFEERLTRETGALAEPERFIAALRHAKKREILRIGTRDICYGAPLEEITAELSRCAEAQIRAALGFAWREAGGRGRPPVTVGAFGKLGGGELNYSSDLDLIGIAAADGLDREEGRRLMERMRGLLSSPSPHGSGYRIDFRLRPFGRAGSLTVDLEGLESYYRGSASPWELQALLKLRLIDPDERTAAEFERRIRPLLLTTRPPQEIIEVIRANRSAAIEMNRDLKRGLREIKNGPGGIRTIEFLLQGLQLIHAPGDPALLCGSSLEALELLGNRELLSPIDRRTLDEAYRVLRRAEHFLQLHEDRQLHSLPSAPEKLEILARRCAGLPGTEFLTRIETLMNQVERIAGEYFANAAGV